MTFRTTDPLRGLSRGTVAQALSYAMSRGAKRPDDLTAYATELYRLCVAAQVPFPILFSQACDETAVFTSDLWVKELNPAGIGALETLDKPGEINYVGGSYTALGAARAHAVHLGMYVFGDPLPPALAPFRGLDPRADAVVKAGYAGKAKAVADLSGRWAVNPNYAVQIVAHANRAFSTSIAEDVTKALPVKETTMANMAKGLIPMPHETLRLGPGKVENVGMNRIGTRRFQGLCLHRGLSGKQTLDGAVDWLLRPTTAGLTDLYIDHRDGRMVRMIPPPGSDPRGDMTPWAQGPYNASAASSDAKAFVAMHAASSGMGVSAWNGWLESIEITGDYHDPISEATKRTLIHLAASRAHDRGTLAERYPIGPDGLSQLYAHREGCGVAYKACAGSVVWTYINSEAFIEAVRKLMASYQTGAAKPALPAMKPLQKPTVTYAPLITPAYLSDTDPAPVVEDGATKLYLVTDQYRAVKPTPRLQLARQDALRVGPDMRAGEDASISYVFQSSVDGQDYGMSNYGTRFLLADMERVSDVPAKAA